MTRIVRNRPTSTYTCVRGGQTYSFAVRDGGCVGATSNCKTMLAVKPAKESARWSARP